MKAFSSLVVVRIVKLHLPVTVKTHSAEFPAKSVKVYVTGVVPTLKKLPGWWLLETVGIPPELSVAVGGIQVTGTDDVPDDTDMVMEFGHPKIIGATLSTANTEKIQ